MKHNSKGLFRYHLFVENWKLITENTAAKQFLKVWIVLWDLKMHRNTYFVEFGGPVNSAVGPQKNVKHTETNIQCYPNSH